MTKNGIHCISKNLTAKGMIPITKNILVVDEQGNEYEATWPKRARGLVKNGRARFLSENMICLACPPGIDMEDNEMTNIIMTDTTVITKAQEAENRESGNESTAIENSMESVSAAVENSTDNAALAENTDEMAKSVPTAENADENTESVSAAGNADEMAENISADGENCTDNKSAESGSTKAAEWFNAARESFDSGSAKAVEWLKAAKESVDTGWTKTLGNELVKEQLKAIKNTVSKSGKAVERLIVSKSSGDRQPAEENTAETKPVQEGIVVVNIVQEETSQVKPAQEETAEVKPTQKETADPKASEAIDKAYVFAQIKAIQDNTDYLYRVVESLAQISDRDGGDHSFPTNVQAQKAAALGDVVRCRETTNQQLLNFYTTVYNDLKSQS